jgi:hypothetical protein
MRKPNVEQKTKKLTTRAQQNAALGTAQKQNSKAQQEAPKPKQKTAQAQRRANKFTAQKTQLIK